MTKEQTIDLSPPQNKILQKILRQQIPNKTVWAFGSRVEWKASETSDLDLVAHKCSGAEIADLKEALEESALLCSVDVLNWEDIPDSFRVNIKKHYVVVQQNTVPEGWRVVKLGDVCEIIGGGTPSTKIAEYWDGGIPWITPRDLSNYQSRYIANGERNISSQGLQNTSAKIVPPQTVLLTTRAPVGYLAISSAALCTNQGFKSFIPAQGKVDSLFLFYLLMNNVDYLKSQSSGTTFGEITGSTLKSLEFSFPTISEQKAIAEVLSSLDDKIDLLRKQNKTLEDMAQTLFCKWFWGGISDGWEIKALDEIADYLNGLACQKHPPQNDKDKLPVLKIRELKNGISENSDWATSAVDDKYIIDLGDIIFSWSGSLMVKLWDGEKCVLNQHLFKVSSECYPNWYIYFWTKHYISKFIQIADSKATTMGHIKREDLSSSMVKVPKPDELSAMNKKILPQFQKMVLNYKQIRALEELRDMLLSKLVSGEIRSGINL